jgi:hypothetical protein
MATQGQRRPRRRLLEVALESARPIKQVHQPPLSDPPLRSRVGRYTGELPTRSRSWHPLSSFPPRSRGQRPQRVFYFKMMLHYLTENNTTIYLLK